MLYKIATALALTQQVMAAGTSSSSSSMGSTCYDIKSAYQSSSCCNSNLQQETTYTIAAAPPTIKEGTNPCAGTKPKSGFDNFDCVVDGVIAATEQAGANVTKGFVGGLNTTMMPITGEYLNAGLCPVNVHWHLGAEHLSVGEYDEDGVGPAAPGVVESNGRRLAGDVTRGFRCHKYDGHDSRFTTEYDWKHCVGMHVGETYEVHWPHSKGGACGTPNQYQTPFYDGVFCQSPDTPSFNLGGPEDLPQKVGVQSQVFTIVNDEHYYYPDLMRGAIHDGQMWHDVAKYTGSTTGTSRSNTVCSAYSAITWQVDRKCHLISASTFDKMCQDMKAQRDDMSDDLHAHGSRELVAPHLSANNLHRK